MRLKWQYELTMRTPAPMSEMHYEIGSANVYADLNQVNANALLSKAKLVRKITALIEERKLSRARAADLLGIPQPTLSGMLRGQFGHISKQRLADALVQLRIRSAQQRVSHRHG